MALPRCGKQMHAHDSVPLSKERCHTTNARREKIFSDMSWAPLTVAKETRVSSVWSATGGGKISPGDNFAGDNFAGGKFRHP